MADIKVEKQGGNSALWWLLAALVVAGILAFTLFNRGEERTAAGLYNPSQPVASVVYQGERWEPQGEARNFPDDQMARVGQSQEGYDLYTNRTMGGGGGAGEPTSGEVFLKTTGGTYVPLYRQDNQ